MSHAAQLVSDQSTRIAEILRARLSCDGAFPTAISGLQIVRKSRVPNTRHIMDAAKICYVAQGAKAIFYSGKRLVYNSSTVLVLPVSVPLTGEIVDAKPSRPMLSMSMSLNLEELASTLQEMPRSDIASHEVDLDCVIRPITSELLDALCRYVSLLSEPQAIPALAPAIRREIHYRLLTGAAGVSLRILLARRAEISSIGQALVWFRQHAYEPIAMQELADRANMSEATMFKTFKRLTSMSPVQFQKQLRLQEARRMLLAGDGDITSISTRVGYSSPSQFSREYRRLFEAPPRRDIQSLLAQEHPETRSATSMRS